MKFSDIEMAFEYVSSAELGINHAYLSRLTGLTHYVSDLYGSDEELPDDIDDASIYLSIPHKNELGLGRQLALDFVSEFLPADYDTVYDIFNRKGAYSRYKQLLESRSKLDQWYRYETEKQKEALIDWCQENHIQIDID